MQSRIPYLGVNRNQKPHSRIYFSLEIHLRAIAKFQDRLAKLSYFGTNRRFSFEILARLLDVTIISNADFYTVIFAFFYTKMFAFLH